MANHRRINRSKCEACGAPLVRTMEDEGFVCKYCGATYYSDNQKENKPKENSELESEIYSKLPVLPVLSSPIQANKRIKSTTWVWVSLLTVILSCVIFAAFNDSIKSKNIDSRESNNTRQKPSMLASLPTAEKAGKALAYNGWEIIVAPEVEVYNNRLFFGFEITNWNDKAQTFNYTPKNIIVYDDLGNTYNLERYREYHIFCFVYFKK